MASFSIAPARRTCMPGKIVTFPAWAAAVLLLVFTAGAGFAAGGLAKYLFLAGCFPIGWLAWRQSPAMHVKTALLLFAFTPLVRRMVDLTAGFDSSSLMLVGPLLALVAVLPSLLNDANNRTLFADRRLGLPVIIFICVLYAVILTIFRGQWNDAIVGAVKWLVPLLYGAALLRFADRDEIIEAATSAFMWILPLTGLYGLYQFVDPPEWDRNWMNFATIMSAGNPLPYEIRTFSTMNGPATFGYFTSIGLILVTFLRPVYVGIPLAAPAAISLLLSQHRAAWIGVVLVLFFTLWKKGTRARAGLIFAGIIGAGMLALMIPTFADVITERLETFTQGNQDHSVQERMEQFVLLWNNPDPWNALLGIGFTTVDVGVAGSMAIDGMFIESWLMLGLVAGPIYLIAFIWINLSMARKAFIEPDPRVVPAAGLAFFTLFQIPFGSFTNGELEFIFWIVASFSLCLRHPSREPAAVVLDSSPDRTKQRRNRAGETFRAPRRESAIDPR